MLQHFNLLPLFIFIFWSCCTLDVVISDPQIQLLSAQCNPPDFFLVSDSSILTGNLNETFGDIRGQIRDQKKHFATAQHGNGENFPVYTLFQCRNYLSIPDCVACFDVAAVQIRKCAAAASPSPGAYVVYDGCFIRYNYNTFFNEATNTFNGVTCGNETTGGASAFTEATQQVLTSLQISTPTIPSFFAATKIQVPKNGSTIYAFAQCVNTITTNGCLNCLKAGYSNLQICLPFSDGRAFDAGCFLRYSTTSLFPDNQTIDITPFVKQGSSGNKGATIGGVVGGVSLALILLALSAWIKRQRRNKKVHRGNHLRSDLTGVSKLKGPVTYSYNDLVLATKNFSEENKLGEGGFGAVFKGTLKNGKVVAVKKLTSYHSDRVEEDFESEVILISNVHHRNLVRLLGCCSKGYNKILVYEYMKNSSLDRFIFGKKKGCLNWKQRLDIIIGIARGLTYLHEEFHVRIIHRDIKTNNILLDDNLQPRIADFGLARLLPENKSHVSTKLAGTLGYTAPEYAIYGQLSEKADIYSYGVVVLEIISGQKCRKINVDDDDEGAFLLQKAWNLYEKGRHLELVDKTLDHNGYDAEEVKKIIEIGLLCTQASAETRPMMSEVVVLLQNKDLLDNIRPTMPILIETN